MDPLELVHDLGSRLQAVHGLQRDISVINSRVKQAYKKNFNAYRRYIQLKKQRDNTRDGDTSVIKRMVEAARDINSEAHRAYVDVKNEMQKTRDDIDAAWAEMESLVSQNKNAIEVMSLTFGEERVNCSSMRELYKMIILSKFGKFKGVLCIPEEQELLIDVAKTNWMRVEGAGR